VRLGLIARATMDLKYYKKDVRTTNYVWFKLLDKTGKVIKDYAEYACYGVIAHGFDKDARQIHIYHSKERVPYTISCIKRWIADINEMGFPCRFLDDEFEDDASTYEKFISNTIAEELTPAILTLMRHGHEALVSLNKFHNFYVNLDDYKDKNHLFSTLSLIRCLTESGICYVPEVYFKIMDADPGFDKLEACQAAHKKVSKKYEFSNDVYVNSGHMITFHGNGENIAHEDLMKRFSKAKVDLRDTGNLKINLNWNGSNGQVL
jgi:hypothetical protein